MGLGGERVDYEGLHLARPDVGPDPIEQFRVWSVEVVSDWSVEVVPVSLCVSDESVEVWASAADPGGGVSPGTVAGTTSWVASSLPQALRPRHATAKSATTYVRM